MTRTEERKRHFAAKRERSASGVKQFRALGLKTHDERPRGCSKGCTGRMCRDALNCDGKR